jgi:hypothetical protein
MDTQKNAPLTPKGREMMVRAVVDEGLSKAAAARRFNTTPKTVAKCCVRAARARVAGRASCRRLARRGGCFGILLPVGTNFLVAAFASRPAALLSAISPPAVC